ncbi:MAG: PIN domain-containing protein [Deltaproteobacteria bacterium]
MKGDKVFLDTNLLLYAYDAGSLVKHSVAARILEDLWKSGNGILSTQVLQEFFVNVTKKIPKPLSVTVGKEIVEDFLKWKIVSVEGRTILRAIDLHEKHNYAFRDSLVIQSAIEGGARWLLSEDLRDGQRIGELTIRNPFLHGQQQVRTILL